MLRVRIVSLCVVIFMKHALEWAIKKICKEKEWVSAYNTPNHKYEHVFLNVSYGMADYRLRQRMRKKAIVMLANICNKWRYFFTRSPGSVHFSFHFFSFLLC